MDEKEKAIAYDKALERAKDCLKDGTITSTAIGYIETIFSELRESVDERIRKGIIDFLWKEKIFLQEVSSHVENNPKYRFVIDAITWLEKQGEQKSADNVEPKFNVGDWIVTDENHIVQIKSIDSNYYVLENTMRFTIDYVDKCWHLWTIQDSEDGDVLVSQYDMPFIYNGNHNDYKVGAFCGIEYTGERFIDTISELCWTDNKSIKPATKEQRDLLFQKMKEAGYEWDAKSKKLKKIEQKPAWSEEDDKRLINTTISFLNHYADKGYENAVECIDWLKSLKERLGGSEHDNVTSKTTNVGNSSITVEGMYNPAKDASV